MSSDPAALTAALEAQLLLDTFRGIDLGAVWLDEQARIVLANDHFAGWAQSDVAALAGRPLADFVEALTPDHWAAIRGAAAGAPPPRLVMAAGRGRRRVLEVRARAASSTTAARWSRCC